MKGLENEGVSFERMEVKEGVGEVGRGVEGKRGAGMRVGEGGLLGCFREGAGRRVDFGVRIWVMEKGVPLRRFCSEAMVWVVSVIFWLCL